MCYVWFISVPSFQRCLFGQRFDEAFILCHVNKQKVATSMKIKYEMEALSCLTTLI